VLRHPWRTFVRDWNWKAAILSTSLRALGCLASFVNRPDGGSVRGLCIELAFRMVLGGFWGSQIQAFRGSEPAWLAGLCVAVLLPGCSHVLEFAALRAGAASHIKTTMAVSIVISIGSVLINWALMRRGLLVTGPGANSLAADLRRLPAALGSMARGA
jgi:hypothetical protein